MRNLIILVIFITFLSCKTKKWTYYHGYLYDTKGNPLSGLIVIGRDHKETKTASNLQGYFKMKKKEGWIERWLYIYNKNKKIDSISVARTHPEFGSNYCFVEGRNDTLFIDFKKATSPDNNGSHEKHY